MALRATVGSERMGATSGMGTLAATSSSSSPASAAVPSDVLATTGMDALEELEVLDVLEVLDDADRCATTGASGAGGISIASGSSAEAGEAWEAAWRCAVRLARRWTGAGIDPDDACSTVRTRATTSPGAAMGLTSWPSCCTTGGRPCVPGRPAANSPGEATSGIDPAVRWIGGRPAQARGRAGTAPDPLEADRLTVGEPVSELPPDAPFPELERRPRPNGRRTENQPSSAIRRLIFPISSTNRCRSGCSRSRIESIGQWKW